MFFEQKRKLPVFVPTPMQCR